MLLFSCIDVCQDIYEIIYFTYINLLKRDARAMNYSIIWLTAMHTLNSFIFIDVFSKYLCSALR